MCTSAAEGWTAPRKVRRSHVAWQVVRYVEPDLAIVSCLKPLDAPRAIRPCCVLKRALEKTRLHRCPCDSYTLSDLVHPRGWLVSFRKAGP